ncbi:hypothetical protein CTRI78_v010577 [Colletotrichum trifolii]|uniref:Uncharacterized protein n=1 Tax=Colletotrichum trifolii TaxID=5466 RepID=A0A4R8QMM4_COLTR|nr:hypothetical protein CTRI78_v010577 [Colletotrichum trifolii]
MVPTSPSPRTYACENGLFLDSRRKNQRHALRELRGSPYFPSNETAADDLGFATLEIPDPIFPPETNFRRDNVDDMAQNLIGIDDHDDMAKLAVRASIPQFRSFETVRKLETPVLRSDIRHDIKIFNKGIATTMQYEFFHKQNPLPLEPVDEDKDEGLGLPKSAKHFHDQLSKGAEPHGLDLIDDAAAHVEGLTSPIWQSQDLQDLINMELDAIQTRARTMSPPLMAPPLESSDEKEPFVPDSDVCMVDPASDPASLLDSDLEAVEQKLVETSVDSCLSDVDIDDLIGITHDAGRSQLSPRVSQNTLVEIEPPIFPPAREGSDINEAEASCRTLIKSWREIPRSRERGTFADTDEESPFEAQFNLLIQAPVMDFSEPVPGWHEGSKDARSMFRWIRQRYQDLFRITSWPRSRTETTDLRWIPFLTAVTPINSKESVGDDRMVLELLDRRGVPLPTSADYVKQKRGLKILIDDEEYEPSGASDPTTLHLGFGGLGDDIMNLIRKRKTPHITHDEAIHDDSPTAVHKAQRQANRLNASRRRDGGLFMGENECNAAAKLLQNYMQMNPAKNKKPGVAQRSTANPPPLPGAKIHMSQLRERVTKTAPRYGRLIILVSEDNKTNEDLGTMDETSAAAYNSFLAFALSLGNTAGCRIRVIYVGGGGQTLETWTCALVSYHVKENAPQARRLLYEDETEWEVFLRGAGCNIYAAQVIVAVFKGMYQGQDERPLVRFLRMGAAERMKILAPFVGVSTAGGGRPSLVDRVSARLG